MDNQEKNDIYSIFLANQIAENLEKLRQLRPLVYAITNFVTINDVANVLLALGASPVMAQAEQEAEEIISASSSILINMGTLTQERLNLLKTVSQIASNMDKAVVLDPVGAGGSLFRTEAAKQILHAPSVKLLRANLGEATALSDSKNGAITRGVDSIEANLDVEKAVLGSARTLINKKPDLAVAISGKRDYVVNGLDTASWIQIDNGNELLTKISGAGCMLGAICAAFCSVTSPFEAAVSASTIMGVAAELAAQTAKGPGSFRVNLLDTIYNLTFDQVATYARVKQSFNK